MALLVTMRIFRHLYRHYIFVYSVVVKRNSLQTDKKYTKPKDSQHDILWQKWYFAMQLQRSAQKKGV